MKNLNSGGLAEIFQRTNRTGGKKERVKRSNSRGVGGDLSANTNNEKLSVGFRTIIWRVYWPYVR